jgi:hypothetical protein
MFYSSSSAALLPSCTPSLVGIWVGLFSTGGSVGHEVGFRVGASVGFGVGAAVGFGVGS